mgnify:CR=1 FL=1
MPFNKKEWSKPYNQQWYINNHKKTTITRWEKRGVIDENLSLVYDYFITQTHCWICDMEYNKSYKRCLDHDHDELVNDNIRYICCHPCNSNIVG